MNAEISETIRARLLGFGNCGSYSFDARVKILTKINCSYQYLSIDPKKSLPRPQTSKNRKYERGYLGNYQRQRIGISDLDSVALMAAHVGYANMTRPQA